MTVCQWGPRLATYVSAIGYTATWFVFGCEGLVFVMLNPSTALHSAQDAEQQRLRVLAGSWRKG